MGADSSSKMLNRRGLVLDRENLAVLVVTAAWAYGMGTLDLAALRANGAANRGALVVCGTTRMGANPASFTLRYCHRYLPFLHSVPESYGTLKYFEHAKK